MSAHIATPSEIGGAASSDEVVVHHLKGAYEGMTLLNKADDATLKPAVDAGEIIILQGSPDPVGPSTLTGGTSTVAGGQSTVQGGTNPAPPDTI